MFTAIILLFTGLCVGSFLNVVIYRLPIMMQRSFEKEAREVLELEEQETSEFNLSLPASHCPKCNNKIKWWHNIPVLSYLLLKGRCGFCDVKISIRYPAVELVTALLTVSLITLTHNPYALAFLSLAVWATIALMLIDLDTFLLPDVITLPLLWLGLIASSMNLFTDLHSAVFGAIAGYLVLWSIYWIFKLLFKKEGMGAGDFKLLAAIGAWLGWQALPITIMLSAGVGSIIGIAMVLAKKQSSQQAIPFGPFLGAAFLCQLFWGDTLSQLLLGQ